VSVLEGKIRVSSNLITECQPAGKCIGLPVCTRELIVLKPHIETDKEPLTDTGAEPEAGENAISVVGVSCNVTEIGLVERDAEGGYRSIPGIRVICRYVLIQKRIRLGHHVGCHVEITDVFLK